MVWFGLFTFDSDFLYTTCVLIELASLHYMLTIIKGKIKIKVWFWSPYLPEEKAHYPRSFDSFSNTMFLEEFCTILCILLRGIISNQRPQLSQSAVRDIFPVTYENTKLFNSNPHKKRNGNSHQRMNKPTQVYTI